MTLHKSLRETFIARPSVLRKPEAAAAWAPVEGGPAYPVFPPESPRTVASEVQTVEHMLTVANHWLASVDVSTVSPAVQERLSLLAGQSFKTVLQRFPEARHLAAGAAAHSRPPPASPQEEPTLQEAEDDTVPLLTGQPSGAHVRAKAPAAPPASSRGAPICFECVSFDLSRPYVECHHLQVASSHGPAQPVEAVAAAVAASPAIPAPVGGTLTLSGANDLGHAPIGPAPGPIARRPPRKGRRAKC